MDRELHEQLVKNTEELRGLVSQCSTEEIAGMCSAFVLNRGTPSERTTILVSPLTSPARQIFFLLGLMLTTSEPVTPRRFDRQEWQKTVELLNAIYSAYTAMFLPKGANVAGLTDEQTKALEVAAPAFLHYFNTGILASVDQISARIRRYIAPFDAQLKGELGISASEALDIAIWITEYFQEAADNLHEAAVEERDGRITLLSRAVAEGWDLDRFQNEMQREEHLSKFGELFRELNSFLKVSRDSLAAQFGAEIADAYWTTFVSERGEVASFTYLTERNIAEEKPLFQMEKGVAFCPVSSALYWAILKVSESHLNSSPSRDAFLKKRDKTLELEVEQTLRRIFGSAAVFYSQVFETETLQHEHDLIVVWNSNLFVIEAKASPPVEPFRDPERAFTRLRRAFQSSRGIQKAYEQANRIRKRLVYGNSVDLFDSNKRHIVEIKPETLQSVYTICVTRDDFGPLATDLSLLLEIEKDEPYPWAVNILDLQNFTDAWEYFGWGPNRLCEYLDDRIELHGKISASDEMDIVGFFIQHGTLSYLTEVEADLLQLTPDYSNVLDRIYEAEHGGEPVVYEPTEPFMGDMREMLANAPHENTSDATLARASRRKKQGRNELCNCGSGKKYKRCCGR